MTPHGPIAGQRRLAALERGHHPAISIPKEDGMLGRTPSRVSLERDERVARNRLAAFRARLYAHPETDTPARRQRLAELERRWQGAAERLRRAGDGRGRDR